MYRGLRHPVEVFRTAPVQSCILGLSAAVAAFATHAAVELDRTPSNPVEWGVVVVNLGAVALNAVLAKSKIDLRNRLESNLSANGFNERVINMTTDTYCSRQATKVACENTGYSAEYASLLKQNPKKDDLRWLPHI
jgi:hypothetical protein